MGRQGAYVYDKKSQEYVYVTWEQLCRIAERNALEICRDMALVAEKKKQRERRS